VDRAAVGAARVTFSGPQSATLPIMVAPMILVGLIVRKWLVTGLTLGAVTGE
jgi:multiple sugar transport system permease protein